MISTQGFESNENRMELFQEGLDGFPCMCKFVDLKNYVGNRVPWHWHKFSEINFMTNGTGLIHVSDREFEITQGEAVFVNSNSLHALDATNPEEYPQYYTIFFDNDFLTGGIDSLFSQKYLLPVTTCRELQTYPVRPNSPMGIKMLNTLIRVIDIFRDEPFGFEFAIRSALSEFWLMLYQATEEVRAGSENYSIIDETRIKLMLQYIEEHYRDKVLLEDIADAAGISGRECGRCFKATVGMSPIDYLNRYRIRTAAGRIAESNDPVSIIAEEAGFLSDSYFSKMFKSVMGCTPRDYRNAIR